MEYFSPSIIWLLAGVGLLLIELLTPGLFFFISFAFGSLFGALAAVLGYSVTVQSLIALGVSLIQFLGMRRRLKQFTDSVHAPTNMHALHGKKGVVLSEITPLNAGSVKVGGEQWAASSLVVCPVGACVKVLRVEGNRLIVSLESVKE
jgi:membrane protein implicated in regulation of membrane protease activity